MHASGIAGFLTVLMGARAIAGGKFMPPGMVAVISAIALYYLRNSD